MSYAAGFAQGERAAFADRQRGMTRPRPTEMRDEYMRGWWDGYTPRSLDWAARSATTRCAVHAWWEEKDTEPA